MFVCRQQCKQEFHFPRTNVQKYNCCVAWWLHVQFFKKASYASYFTFLSAINVTSIRCCHQFSFKPMDRFVVLPGLFLCISQVLMMLTVFHVLVVICVSSAELAITLLQIVIPSYADCKSFSQKSVVLSFHPNAGKKLKSFIVCSF